MGIYLPKAFSGNILHLSGCEVMCCHTMLYRMKDVSGIFQSSFMAESDKKICAKRFFNLSQAIFRSAPNGSSI